MAEKDSETSITDDTPAIDVVDLLGNLVDLGPGEPDTALPSVPTAGAGR